jgi:hypothetical protein
MILQKGIVDITGFPAKKLCVVTDLIKLQNSGEG